MTYDGAVRSEEFPGVRGRGWRLDNEDTNMGLRAEVTT